MVFPLEASLLVLVFLSQDKPWSVPYYYGGAGNDTQWRMAA